MSSPDLAAALLTLLAHTSSSAKDADICASRGLSHPQTHHGGPPRPGQAPLLQPRRRRQVGQEHVGRRRRRRLTRVIPDVLLYGITFVDMYGRPFDLTLRLGNRRLDPIANQLNSGAALLSSPARRGAGGLGQATSSRRRSARPQHYPAQRPLQRTRGSAPRRLHRRRQGGALGGARVRAGRQGGVVGARADAERDGVPAERARDGRRAVAGGGADGAQGGPHARRRPADAGVGGGGRRQGAPRAGARAGARPARRARAGGGAAGARRRRRGAPRLRAVRRHANWRAAQGARSSSRWAGRRARRPRPLLAVGHTADGSYEAWVCNAGAGVEYHPCRVDGDRGRARQRADAAGAIPAARATDANWWWAAFRPLVFPDEGHGPAPLYEQLLPYLNGRPAPPPPRRPTPPTGRRRRRRRPPSAAARSCCRRWRRRSAASGASAAAGG